MQVKSKFKIKRKKFSHLTFRPVFIVCTCNYIKQSCKLKKFSNDLGSKQDYTLPLKHVKYVCNNES